MKTECWLSSRAFAVFVALVAFAIFFTACDDGTRDFRVTFHANGGTGIPPNPMTASPNTTIQLPDADELSKNGFAFGGWNIRADGTGTNFTVEMPVTGDTRLYARWILVPPLTGTVSITGIAQVGQRLTAEIAALDGSGLPSFEWRRGGTPISSAHNSTYVVQNADVGQAITVRVTRFGYSAYVISTPTATVLGTLTGAVSIIGTPVVGQTLTANIAALGGSGPPFFEWRRGGNLIHGANSNTYIVQPADVGLRITVTVTRAGEGSRTSPSTAIVLAPLTGVVGIIGTPIVGQRLTADIANLGGTGTVSFSWRRGDTPISFATSSIYYVQPHDVGRTIALRVTRIGYWGYVVSDPTTTILAPLAGTVSITGNAWIGETLTANMGNLGGSGDISFQWERGTTPIPEATGSSYNVQATDMGYTIRVTVSRTGNSGSVTSVPTAIVIPTPPALTGMVSITGTAEAGQTLTANIANLGGTGTVSFQWMRAGNPIFGATGSSYAVRNTDVGHTITVMVTRAGNSGYVVSDGIGPVPLITWTATFFTDGNFTWNSGIITFTFSADPGQVLRRDITIIPETGSATRTGAASGAASGAGTVRTLNVSNVRDGTILIFIDWPGVADGPQIVTVRQQ